MTAEPLSLLAVKPHPDDEAITMGGTLARYSAEGVRTTLITATRGEVGEILDGRGLGTLDLRYRTDAYRVRTHQSPSS
jgi:LmbE family N-acetylglucosaminyl deacetylase